MSHIKILVTEMTNCLVMGPPFSSACRVFVVDTKTPQKKRIYPHWFRVSWVNHKIYMQNKEVFEGYLASSGVTLASFAEFFLRVMKKDKAAKNGNLHWCEYDFIENLKRDDAYESAFLLDLKQHFPKRSDALQWFERHIEAGIKSARPDVAPQFVKNLYDITGEVEDGTFKVKLTLGVVPFFSKEAFDSNLFMVPFCASLESDPLYPILDIDFQNYHDQLWSYRIYMVFQITTKETA